MNIKEIIITLLTLFITIASFVSANLSQNVNEAGLIYSADLNKFNTSQITLQNYLNTQNVQSSNWINCLNQNPDDKKCTFVQDMMSAATESYRGEFNRLSKIGESINADVLNYQTAQETRSRYSWLDMSVYILAGLIIVVIFFPFKNKKPARGPAG